MALEPLIEEKAPGGYKVSLLVIFVWSVWLAFVSTINFPFSLSIGCSAIVLLYGSVVWRIREGAVYFLVMSWIYGHFSLTPPGMFWLSLFVSFLILKPFVARFEIKSVSFLSALILLAAFLLEVFQIGFISRLVDVPVLSLSLIVTVVLSSLLQTIIASLIVFNIE